jgi:GNAT superfamily N-acetyltransferase
MSPDNDAPGWAEHLRPGAVRYAHASRHYDKTITFYRDLVGLPVIGEFTGSFAEDGTIFGFPDFRAQLEVVRAHEPGDPGTFDQLVLYLDDASAVTAATAPLRAAGRSPIADPHPYWAANGAVTFSDPDGRQVVFAPWVYGREPDPIDRVGAGSSDNAIRVTWYDGDRDALRPLFAEAEDSKTLLNGYLNDGHVLAAWRGTDLVGHLQLVPAGDRVVELKNMAVAERLRRTGIGRQLIDTALVAATGEGATRIVVTTASADVGNLRFYQRCGFRLSSVERDAFTTHTGYPEQVVIDGIPLRDRVWLDQPLGSGG